MPDLDALAAMHCLLAWCDLRLALLLGGHWTTALQMLQVVVKGSGAEGASARVVGDLAWAALASTSALASASALALTLTFLFIRCCKQARIPAA